MLNGHGDDIYAFDGGIKYNFSSNVYYKGCPSELLNVLKTSLSNIQNYPSPLAHELNIFAEQHYQIPNQQFLFTNGATETFYLIAQHFKGKKAIITSPTFSEYEDACKIHQMDVSLVSRNELQNTTLEADLIFICNPNNPDGTIFSVQEIKSLLSLYPKSVFVLDEAYIEFSKTAMSCVPLLKEFDNLIIVKSLTKSFAIPGLRLGYMISNADLISQILRYKMPWSVNALAVSVGKYIFQHYESLLFSVDKLLAQTLDFQKELNQIDYIDILPSHTSFFLIRLKTGKASELKKYLANEHQILVRDATNFNGLPGEHIRISTQKHEANQALIKALKQWN